MQQPRPRNDIIPEVAGEIPRCAQIHLPSDQLRQLRFEVRDPDQTDASPGQKLHKHIDIAVWPEVIPQHAPEHRQPRNALPTAQGRDKVHREVYAVDHHGMPL